MNEQPVVEVRGISKHFGEGPTRVDALRELSLDVYPGTVIGLRGTFWREGDERDDMRGVHVEDMRTCSATDAPSCT